MWWWKARKVGLRALRTGRHMDEARAEKYLSDERRIMCTAGIQASSTSSLSDHPVSPKLCEIKL